MTHECRIAALLDAAGSSAEAVSALLDAAGNSGGVNVCSSQWSPRRLSPGIQQHWAPWANQAGACAIHCAAETGRHEAVKLLISRGAPIDEKTRYCATALMLAAFGGHHRAVAVLLDAGASVDAYLLDMNDGRGPTALDLACCAAADGGAECVRLLLAAGASVHTATEDGCAPLHYAVRNSRPVICAALVAAGAWAQHPSARRLTPTASFRESPLAMARRMAHSEACAKPGADRSEIRSSQVLCELHWLPSVRLLWLGHRAPRATAQSDVSSVSPEGSSGGTNGEASAHASTAPAPECAEDDAAAALASPLQRLTQDALRLVVLAIVESHSPDWRARLTREEPAAEV